MATVETPDPGSSGPGNDRQDPFTALFGPEVASQVTYNLKSVILEKVTGRVGKLLL